MSVGSRGFSLLELLVVISILAVLVTVVTLNLSYSQAQTRDTKRQASLVEVQTALALYKNKYGRYPEACRGPTTGTNVRWSGQLNTSYACAGSSTQYIIGLAPEFIPRLPVDPKAVSNTQGYVYTVNSDGSVYKFMSINSVEAETISNTENHKFFRCGEAYDASTSVPVSDSFYDTDMCKRSPAQLSGTSMITHTACTQASHYENTYAVSGGTATVDTSSERSIEYYTELIRCQ